MRKLPVHRDDSLKLLFVLSVKSEKSARRVSHFAHTPSVTMPSAVSHASTLSLRFSTIPGLLYFDTRPYLLLGPAFLATVPILFLWDDVVQPELLFRFLT